LIPGEMTRSTTTFATMRAADTSAAASRWRGHAHHHLN
jgi:hypothetical protein